MRRGALLRIALALAPLCAASAAERDAPDVAVFTLSTIPVRADGAAVYELDRRDRLAAAFGADLPSDPERARAAMRRRMDAPEGRELRLALAKAAEGNALAARLGVEKLPAVVVDGRYAVYGVRDARRAAELVRAWRLDNGKTVHGGPGDARSLPHPDRGTSPARPLRRRGDRR